MLVVLECNLVVMESERVLEHNLVVAVAAVERRVLVLAVEVVAGVAAVVVVVERRVLMLGVGVVVVVERSGADVGTVEVPMAGVAAVVVVVERRVLVLEVEVEVAEHKVLVVVVVFLPDHRLQKKKTKQNKKHSISFCVMILKIMFEITLPRFP